MIINFWSIFSIYLVVNAIISIICKILIDKYDAFGDKSRCHLPAWAAVILSPMFIVAVLAAYAYGFGVAIILDILGINKPQVIENEIDDKSFKFYLSILSVIACTFLYTPLFLVLVLIDLYKRICYFCYEFERSRKRREYRKKLAKRLANAKNIDKGINING